MFRSKRAVIIAAVILALAVFSAVILSCAKRAEAMYSGAAFVAVKSVSNAQRSER